MSYEFVKSTLVSVAANSAVAAQTALNTAVLDMDGFDAVTFICKLNTVTDTSILTLTAYENTTSSTSNATAVTGGASTAVTASTSSNTIIVVDVIRPKMRYCFASLTRTVANCVVDSIIALQYRAREVPVTQPAAVIAAQLSTPEV